MRAGFALALSWAIPSWKVVLGSVDWEGPPPNCGWQASEGSDSLDLVGDKTGGIGGVSASGFINAGAALDNVRITAL